MWRIVRHNVTNVRFPEMTPHQARVACYFTVITEVGLDHYGRYRDLFVPVGDQWRGRRRGSRRRDRRTRTRRWQQARVKPGRILRHTLAGQRRVGVAFQL